MEEATPLLFASDDDGPLLSLLRRRRSDEQPHRRRIILGVAVVFSAAMLILPRSAPMTADLSVHDDQLDDAQVVDCSYPNATDFPSVLQHFGGYVIGGKPWGGVLLSDRGQYAALHGEDYDPAETSSAIVDAMDDALAACVGDGDCSYEFDTTCRLEGDYDDVLNCVESCVEDRFRTFHDPKTQPIGFDPDSCDDPVLATLFYAPELFKSCLSPDYQCRDHGVICKEGCYDCISACDGVETLAIQSVCHVPVVHELPDPIVHEEAVHEEVVHEEIVHEAIVHEDIVHDGPPATQQATTKEQDTPAPKEAKATPGAEEEEHTPPAAPAELVAQ